MAEEIKVKHGAGEFSESVDVQSSLDTPNSDTERKTATWLITGTADRNQKQALNDLEAGQILTWQVPTHASAGDRLLFWVAKGPGLSYAATLVSQMSTSANETFAEIEINQRLANPVPFSQLKQHPVLSRWSLVKRNMQGAIRAQTEPLESQPDVWPALVALLVETNPEMESWLGPNGLASAQVSLAKNLLSDVCAEQDHIGYGPIVASLAAFLKTKRTRFPLTIAVDAPWGAGKSSVMRMLQLALQPGLKSDEKQANENIKDHNIHLTLANAQECVEKFPDCLQGSGEKTGNSDDEEKERQFETVYFNAWRHGSGEKLTATLVNHIMNTVADRLPPVEQEKFWFMMNLKRLNKDAIRKQLFFNTLASSAMAMAAIGLMIVGLLGVVLFPVFKLWSWSAISGMGAFSIPVYLWKIWPDLQKRAAGFDYAAYFKAPDYDSLIGPQQEIEKDFRETLVYLENHGKNLAIFVDDLDRCPPDQVVKVVESINVFFGQENVDCVFILGMHRELVASSLELAYGNLINVMKQKPQLAEELPFGQRFLEKIVQFVVRLPQPRPEHVERYVRFLAGNKTDNTLSDVQQNEEQLQRMREDPSFFDKIEKYQDSIKKKLVNDGLDESIADDVSSGYIEQVRAEKIARSIDDRHDDVLNVFNAVKHGLRLNPRQYVRFFNALRFHYHLNAAEFKKIPTLDELLDLAKQTVITLEWPALASMLNMNRESFAEMKEAAGSKAELQTWLIDYLSQNGAQGGTETLADEALKGNQLLLLLQAVTEEGQAGEVQSMAEEVE